MGEESIWKKSKLWRYFNSVLDRDVGLAAWVVDEVGNIDSELCRCESSGAIIVEGVDSADELSPFPAGVVMNSSCFASSATTFVEGLFGSSNCLFFASCEVIGSSENDFNTHFRKTIFANVVVGPTSMYVGLALSECAIW